MTVRYNLTNKAQIDGLGFAILYCLLREVRSFLQPYLSSNLHIPREGLAFLFFWELSAHYTGNKKDH
jgi:hypothetical protein